MTTKINVDRTPRETEERSHQDRIAEARKSMKSLRNGPLHIDPSEVPEGLQWGWIVSKIRHEPQDISFSEARLKGWEPIPAQKYPQLSYLCTPNYLNNRKEASEIIEIGGQVLCERPIELKYIEEERDALSSASQNDTVRDFVSGQGLDFDNNAKYSNRPNDFGK